MPVYFPMMNSAISLILFKSRTGISISSLGAKSVAKAIMPGTFGNKYGYRDWACVVQSLEVTHV